MRQRTDRYTYVTAGFNTFMQRSQKSNPLAQNVKRGFSRGSGKPINFSLQQMAGSIGDKVQLGRLILDGQVGRVITTDGNGVETGWMGNISNG